MGACVGLSPASGQQTPAARYQVDTVGPNVSQLKVLDCIHGTVKTQDGPQMVEYFDHSAIDRNLGFQDPNEPDTEPGVSFPDVAAVLSLLIEFICKPKTVNGIAARAESLHLYLDPQNSRYSRLAEVGQAYGLTRAGLSKSVQLELRDACGIHLCLGKRAFARDSYRRSQRAALAAGCHSSQRRAASKAARVAETV